MTSSFEHRHPGTGDYSLRSATIGSTLAARRAGINESRNTEQHRSQRKHDRIPWLDSEQLIGHQPAGADRRRNPQGKSDAYW